MSTTQPEPKMQCRHVFTDGRRCAALCLRHEPFCYFHHTARRPVENPSARRRRSATFTLPELEDRAAIQLALGEVLQRIAANDLDPKRAGHLLYGLQIAASLLPKLDPKAQPTTVAEITHDPELGDLAPAQLIGADREPTELDLILQALRKPQPTIDIQATSNPELKTLNPEPLTKKPSAHRCTHTSQQSQIPPHRSPDIQTTSNPKLETLNPKLLTKKPSAHRSTNTSPQFQTSPRRSQASSNPKLETLNSKLLTKSLPLIAAPIHPSNPQTSPLTTKHDSLFSLNKTVATARSGFVKAQLIPAN